MIGVAVANATLTAIKGGGRSEDYDTAEGTDTARWSGSAGSYVVEQLVSAIAGARNSAGVFRGSELDLVDVTRLIVPLEQGLLAVRGDTVTYTWRGTTYNRKVQNIEPAEVAGTVRLYLEDA